MTFSSAPLRSVLLRTASAAITVAGSLAVAAPSPETARAKQIINQTGLSGGVVVHLGCGDGKLTAALRVSDSFLVQGLDPDSANVAAAREHVRSTGAYGPVSVDQFSGRALPYIDGFVNLLVVASGKWQVASEEAARVLAPGGVLMVEGEEFSVPSSLATRHSSLGGWRVAAKPRPPGIDDWTHFLHSPSNNPVSQDRVVAPPARLQWVGGPRYSRHHDRLSSVSAVVSAAGRVFTIFDEATRVSVLVAPKWSLIARDAFNGTVLWRRPIETWHPHLHGLKSGPASLPRRLVAVGDRVYVTLGVNAPVTALDAATGETLHTYAETERTHEIIVSDDTLFLVAGFPNAVQKRGWWAEGPCRVMAVSISTGSVLWARERSVAPVTMAVDEAHVYYLDQTHIVCLDRDTGGESWRVGPVRRGTGFPPQYAPTLLVHDGVVLFAGGETAAKKNKTWYLEGDDSVTAYSADTGEELWTGYHPPSGYASPEDVFVAGGLVWSGETTSGRAVGVFTGRDLRTGEVKTEFPPDVKTYWFHHRCHRGKATENYLLTSRTGIEFIDFRKKHWDTNHWVRGACLYGVMPANGLTYAPQHPCACYLEAKLSGFNALASAATVPASPEPRLTRGPAFNLKSAIRNPQSAVWPTHRGDTSRSGHTDAAVPATLAPGWQTAVGGRLSSVVVADGKLFVASIDAHTVHGLDAATGETLWQFTTGARVDSPPTFWKGRVLFGSRDGHVYCLNASDGALAWRFRAGPNSRRAMAFEQLESLWPVHGSVLVLDDIAYFVSGRSMFLDGGLRLFRLDPATGSVLSETVLDDRESGDDKGVEDYVSWLNMPTGLPDVLCYDRGLVFMRGQPFDKSGKRLPLEKMPCGPNADAGAPPATQNWAHAHLFSPTGLLDDSWWHRTYWMYGSRFVSGWQGYFRSGKAAPAGRILAFDDSRIYGFGREQKYFRWTTPIEHHLFATARPGPSADDEEAKPVPPKFDWSVKVPLFARGMVLAKDTLFIAGPPDTVDETKLQRQTQTPDGQAVLAEYADALAGKKGGLLWSVSTENGQRLAEHKLDAPPVFDGMAATPGKLFLALTDGTVMCMAGAE